MTQSEQGTVRMSQYDREYASPADIADGFRESDASRWSREQLKKRGKPVRSEAMSRLMADRGRDKGTGAKEPGPGFPEI